MYLCERDAGMQGEGAIDIFYPTRHVSNRQLAKMWARHLRIWRFARYADMLSRLLPGRDAHIVNMPSDRDLYNFYATTGPHLGFTAQEERLGQEALRRLGVPEAKPFVCIYGRDSAYLKKVQPEGKVNWDYHDYRDMTIRNFLPAAEELTKKGYYIIRVGSVVEEALETQNPMIVEYSTSGLRTEFLDIYLCAKCSFFLGVSGGLVAVPMVFRQPIVYVNCIPLEYVFASSPQDILIPKKLWLRGTQRFLTFREILESGAGRYLHAEDYERAGIDIVENTPEEIAAAALEMDDRLGSRWQSTEEDEELQRRFRALFKTSEINGEFNARIGAGFLRQNRQML
jgi:putative glycosyltransferase (TIGR04372 family)